MELVNQADYWIHAKGYQPKHIEMEYPDLFTPRIPQNLMENLSKKQLLYLWEAASKCKLAWRTM